MIDKPDMKWAIWTEKGLTKGSKGTPCRGKLRANHAINAPNAPSYGVEGAKPAKGVG